MNRDREYQNYVNTDDKLLKELDEIRLKLSQRIRRMTPQDQLVYFKSGEKQNAYLKQGSCLGYGLMRDKGKIKYKTR